MRRDSKATGKVKRGGPLVIVTTTADGEDEVVARKTVGNSKSLVQLTDFTPRSANSVGGRVATVAAVLLSGKD